MIGKMIGQLPQRHDGRIIVGDAMDVAQLDAHLEPILGLLQLSQGEAHIGAAPAGDSFVAQESPGIHDRLPHGQFGIHQVDVVRDACRRGWRQFFQENRNPHEFQLPFDGFAGSLGDVVGRVGQHQSGERRWRWLVV